MATSGNGNNNQQPNTNTSNRDVLDKSKTVMQNIDKLFNEIARSNMDAARTSIKLNDCLEALTKEGATKLLEATKKQIKGVTILNDRQVDQIKTVKDLTAVLDKLEDIQDEISRAEKRRDEYRERRYKKEGVYSQKAADGAQRRYERDLAQLGLDEKHANQIKDTTSKLKDLAERTLDAEKNTGKLNEALKKHTNGLIESLKNWASFGAGMDNMTSAVKQGVGEWIKLSQVGLQGTFVRTQVAAMQLRLSFEEMSEVIGKSRSAILQLGGGSEGIEHFVKMVDDASAGLSMLGPKEASKAAAMFINTVSSLGVDLKDQQAYNKQITKMTDNFKEFSKYFGDSPEIYNELIKVQGQDFVMRSKMIGLGRKQMGVVADEIAARVKNEKMIGMSNEGLTDFNKKLNEITNPEEYDPVKNQSEAISLGNSVATLRQQQPDNKDLENAVPKLNELRQAHADGDNAAFQAMMGKKEYTDAAKAWSTAQDIENQQNKKGMQRMVPNMFLHGMGGLGALMRSAGMQESQHADLVGQNPSDNINGMSPDQKKKMDEAQNDMTAFGLAMKTATTVTETWEAVMSNTLMRFTEGLSQTLLSFMKKLGITGEAATAITALAATITAAGTGATIASLMPKAAGMGLEAAKFAAKGGGILGVITGLTHSDNAGNANESGDLWKQSKGTAGINPNGGGGVSGPLTADTKDLADAGRVAGIDPRFLANMGNFESTGDQNAKNSKSSATGLFQFTDDAWRETMRKHSKEAGYDIKGMSDESLLNLRRDPRASAMMAAFYAKDNQAITGATDPGSMYLAHLLGPYGAKDVLTAPDSTPLTQLIKGKAYSGNAPLFDKVKTVGGLKAWANNKMTGGQGSDQTYTGVQKWDPSMAKPNGTTDNGQTVNGSIDGLSITPVSDGAKGASGVDASPVTSAVGTTKVDPSPVANAVQSSNQVASGGITPQGQAAPVTPAGSSTPINPQTVELAKQTELLEAIARNTAKQPRSIVPEAQRSPNTRRDAATSN